MYSQEGVRAGHARACMLQPNEETVGFVVEPNLMGAAGRVEETIKPSRVVEKCRIGSPLIPQWTTVSFVRNK